MVFTSTYDKSFVSVFSSTEHEMERVSILSGSSINRACNMPLNLSVKDRYIDFSHLTELKNIYITEIYMKKQCKLSITKKIKKKKVFLDDVPVKGYVASFSYF